MPDNTYEILKSVYDAGSLVTDEPNNTYEVFKAVYDEALGALRIRTDQASIDVYSTASFSATLTDADTYYDIISPNLTAAHLKDFEYNVLTGEITYIGTETDKKIVFIGTSDVSSDDIANQLWYALFQKEVSGSYVAVTETPTDFTALDRLKNIAKNRIIYVNEGDKIKVMAKCNVAGTTITAATLQLTFFGI